MRCKPLGLSIFVLLAGRGVAALTLTEVAQLPPLGSDRMVFGDSDHDGFNEVFLAWRDPQFNFFLRIYEVHADNSYTLEYQGPQTTPLALGDIDGDGKSDLVAMRSSELRIYESPTATALPTELVWTYPISNFQAPTRIADTDRDGRMELLFFQRSGAFSKQLKIFETTGDNSYSLVYSIPLQDAEEPVIGDLDGDGRIEIAFCGYKTPKLRASEMTVIESPSDNTWAVTFTDSAGLSDGGFGAGGYDADGNDTIDLFFAGFRGQNRAAVVYEPCGDDCFQRTATMEFNDGTTGYGHATFGNLDGAGLPEYVIESNTLRIFRAVAPRQWTQVATLTDPDPNGSHRDAVTFDANGNGRPELFWSTQGTVIQTTLIFESEVPTSIAEIPQVQLRPFTVSPIPSGQSITLRAPESLRDAKSAALYDVAGRVVERVRLPHAGPDRFLWMLDAPQGVYFVVLEAATGAPLASRRVVIAR